LFRAARGSQAVAANGALLHASRESKTDLEISWPAVDGAGAVHGFVAYKDLLGLPQMAATVVSDENFTEMHAPSVKVTGVEVGVLEQHLQVPAGLDLMLARCVDGYAGPYPAEYVAAHRPILVLTVNGMTMTEWARTTGNEDPGPYMISYENFAPAWKVLAHQDRAQVPTGVLEMAFKQSKDVFGPITPPARFEEASPERAGFAIAKQNCLRCHAAGPYGGTKAGLSWEVLSGLALRDRAEFERYVKDPKSVSAKAKMVGTPQYDAATLAAVSAYFRSLGKE
jgi:mono/diheme cytochrome c family protein